MDFAWQGQAQVAAEAARRLGGAQPNVSPPYGLALGHGGGPPILGADITVSGAVQHYVLPLPVGAPVGAPGLANEGPLNIDRLLDQALAYPAQAGGAACDTRPAAPGPESGPTSPAAGQGVAALGGVPAAKRAGGAADTAVKAKRQCTTQNKPVIAQPPVAALPVAALDDKKLRWNQLAAMVMFTVKDEAALKAGIVEMVLHHRVDSPKAREALVAQLKEYIEDPEKPPLPIDGRGTVPREIHVGDAKNLTLSGTDVKWLYWEEGNNRGQKWFGDKPMGYKAAAAAAAVAGVASAAAVTGTAAAVPVGTGLGSDAGSPRSPPQTCMVAHPDGSPSMLSATFGLTDSPSSNAPAELRSVSTGNLVYKRQQRGDKTEVEDLRGKSGWISDKYLEEVDGTKTPITMSE